MRIISADCHLDFQYLPGDLFTTQASAAMKDHMPYVGDVEGGKAWIYEGKVLRYIGSVGVAGDNAAVTQTVRTIRTRRKEKTGLFSDALEGRFRPGDPELRFADMDLDGVSAEVIYGILGLSRRVNNPEVMTEVFRIYNDFVYSQFRKPYPDRFAPLACLPFNSPEAAAQELHRVAELGFTGAELLASDSIKPVWDRDWDPVWAAADETGLPISFHNQGTSVREVPADDPHREENTRARDAVNHAVSRFGSAQFMASIIYSGAFDRFPGFRFVLGESSIGWIPYFLQRMDYEYVEESSFHGNLRVKPSEYFQSNGFVTFERDAIGVQLVELIGEDNVMWGSDYPHPDGTWPESQRFIEEDFRKTPDRIKTKVLHDTAAKLYRLN